MSKGLFGTVVIDRQTAEDDLWLCEPFSRGQAWLDLTLLANDEPRSLMVRGVPVRLEKGQVGRSVLNLAERWQWSREKTRSFLDDLRDRRKIAYKMDNVATVVTVLDYGVFNREKVHDQTAEPTADPTPEPCAEPTQNIGTGEHWNENSGTGEGPPGLKNAPPLDKALEYFSGLDSGYAEAEIKAAWHELTAGAVDGNWVTGRPLRPVADWRSALESELWKRRQIFGEKRAAPVAGANGHPPGWQEGDEDLWWTGELASVEGAAAGAWMAQDRKKGARLDAIIAQRKGGR